MGTKLFLLCGVILLAGVIVTASEGGPLVDPIRVIPLGPPIGLSPLVSIQPYENTLIYAKPLPELKPAPSLSTFQTINVTPAITLQEEIHHPHPHHDEETPTSEVKEKGDSYHIQVGAFSKFSGAASTAAKFKSAGWDAQVAAHWSAKKSKYLYYVWVASYKSLGEAREAKEGIERNGTKAVVVDDQFHYLD